jgi:hypothetical protein
MAATSKTQPTTFADGIQAAMQSLAGAMTAPDADVHFGTEMIKVLSMYIQSKNAPSAPQPGMSQPPGPGATPPPSGAGGGSPAGSIPGGPAGGGAQNPSMPSMQAPSGPTPPGSGPTPGLTPNPDEMRRVMQEVAGQ